MSSKEQTQHHPDSDSGAEDPCTADVQVTASVNRGRGRLFYALCGVVALIASGCSAIPQAKNSGNASGAEGGSKDPVAEFLRKNTPENLDGSVYYSAFGRGNTYSAASDDAMKRLTRFGYTWDENIAPNTEQQPSGEWFVVATGRKTVGDADLSRAQSRDVRPDEQPAAPQKQTDADRAQRERDLKTMAEGTSGGVKDIIPKLPASEQTASGNDAKKQENLPALSPENKTKLNEYLKQNTKSYFQAAYTKLYKKAPLPGVKIVVKIEIDKNGSVVKVTFPTDGNTIKSREFEEIITDRIKFWQFSKSPDNGCTTNSLTFSDQI